MRRKVKRLFLLIVRWSGWLWLWRFLNRKKIIILMGHDVIDPKARMLWFPLRPRLSVDQFDKILFILTKYYNFISLKDAVDMIMGKKPIKSNCVVLTFDDGYRNVIKYGLPILRRYNVPATIFLTVNNIEQRRPFWFDRLDYVFQQIERENFDVQIGKKKFTICSSDRDSLAEAYKAFRDTAKQLIGKEPDFLKEMSNAAKNLEKESGRKLSDIFENDELSAVLTWDEIEAVKGNGVTFGSHSLSHIRLDLADENVAWREIYISKKRIEEATGQSCDFLCYPNGNHNARLVELVSKCGYKAAVTTEKGLNQIRDNPMTLKRIHLPLKGNKIEILYVVSGMEYAIKQVNIWIRNVWKRYGGDKGGCRVSRQCEER